MHQQKPEAKGHMDTIAQTTSGTGHMKSTTADAKKIEPAVTTDKSHDTGAGTLAA